MYRIEIHGFTEQMESEEIKSFIHDVIDSYSITTTADDSGTSVAPTRSQLLFRGTPIEDIIGAHSSDIIAAFGEPELYFEEDSMEYGIEGPDSALFYLSSGDIVCDFTANAADFTFDGQSLAQDFDKLVAILGDDYTDMGGTVHSWRVAWNYGDYQVDVTFPQDSDDNKAYSIYVAGADTDNPANNDDLLNGNELNAATGDSALIGRWRAYDGGYLEFDEYGDASTSFKPYFEMAYKPYSIRWSTENGQLLLTSFFSDTRKWTLDGKNLDLTSSLNQTLRYNRNEESDSLVGVWNKLGSDTNRYFSANALILSDDGTGSEERMMEGWNLERQSFTWHSDDEYIYMDWTQQSVFDYQVTGDVLTIFFSNGSQIYTKVGD